MRRLVAFALLLAGCASLTPLDATVLARLDPHLGQMLLVGFSGADEADNRELDALVCEVRAGGILLSGGNVVDDAQVKRLTAAIRARAAACGASAPLVAMDAEGGRVMRLSPRAGYVVTLSASELAAANDLALTELEARRIGRMLRDAGVGWDLAPVVDVGYNPANAVIVGRGRTYGANPLVVTAHARAFIRGLHAEGVLSALKHFPGHGSSFADSHEGFVDVTATADREVELMPYRALLGERIADAVMIAHVFNRRLDDRYPASLSHATITGLLRQDLGWQGPVVSDDLRMGAIDQHYGLAQAALLALEAGADILLIVEDRLPDGRSAAALTLATIRAALAEGRLGPERVAEALSRVAMLKRRANALAAQ
jgi:beta-N-acetylhexosaminidase